jgi:hypothetical protein
MMLQACLGISVDGLTREVHIAQPRLPIGIDHLRIERLMIGDIALTLEFHRVGDRVVATAPGHVPSRQSVKVSTYL